MVKAVPTATHMALVKLIQDGILKQLVSQNIDGLHRRSGVPPEKIVELHGNHNLEVCTKCGKDYMRDFKVRKPQKAHSHLTGRKCDNHTCNGELKDSIINFGENLDVNILNKGFHGSALSDLCIAMGTSLRVTPAADIPAEVAERGGRLVIINLQKTPLDKAASLCIHAMCDNVIIMLFEKLGIEIPPFTLVRRLKISKTSKKQPGSSRTQQQILFEGVDSNGDPYSLFPKIEFKNGSGRAQEMTSEPMVVSGQNFTGMATAKLFFQGHYNESPATITFDAENLTTKTYVLVYDPENSDWEVVQES